MVLRVASMNPDILETGDMVDSDGVWTEARALFERDLVVACRDRRFILYLPCFHRITGEFSHLVFEGEAEESVVDVQLPNCARLVEPDAEYC